MNTPTKLPQALVIEDTVYIQHWRSDTLAIYQSYTATTPPSNQPIIAPGGLIQGNSLFHLYRVTHNTGEALGEKLGAYSNLIAAMTKAEQVT